MTEFLGIINIGLGALNFLVWNCRKDSWNLGAGIFSTFVGIWMLIS